MEAFEQTVESLTPYLEADWVRAMVVLCGFFILGLMAWFFVTHFLQALAKSTGIVLSEVFMQGVRAPITFTLMAIGVQQAVTVLDPPQGVEYASSGVMNRPSSLFG